MKRTKLKLITTSTPKETEEQVNNYISKFDVETDFTLQFLIDHDACVAFITYSWDDKA